MGKLKKLTQNIVAIFIIVFFLHYLWDQRANFLELLDISIIHATALVAIILLTWALNSLQICFLLRTIGVNMGFAESFFLFIVTAMGNHVPMRPGTILRLHYLKVVHGLQYAKMGSVIGLRMIIMLLVSGIMGVIGMIGFFFENHVISYSLLLIFSGMILFAAIIYVFPPKKNIKQNSWIFRLWNDFTEGFEILRKRPNILLLIMFLILLQMLAMSARLYICFKLIGFHPSPFILLILAPVSVIMIFMAITPGGIGLREGLIGIISVSLGYNFEQGIFAASIDRAFMLFLIFFIGIFACSYIWYRIKRVG